MIRDIWVSVSSEFCLFGRIFSSRFGTCVSLKTTILVSYQDIPWATLKIKYNSWLTWILKQQGRAHICHEYHELYLWKKNCNVEKFQLSIQNLNNLWSFIEVYAVFVPNLCGEKSVRRKSVWRKNDKNVCYILFFYK